LTRIAFVADVHLGCPKVLAGPVGGTPPMSRRAREVQLALESAVRIANGQQCDRLVVLGDLFDTSRPGPVTIAGAQWALRQHESILLLGNHELEADCDHALLPLEPVAKLVDHPLVVSVHGVDLLMVPFRPGPAGPWIVECVQRLANKRRRFQVLCIHAGIRHPGTPAWLADSKDSIGVDSLRELMQLWNIKFVMAGNWHEAASFQGPTGYTRAIVQVGALCPTGFDNPGLGLEYGHVEIVADDGTIESHWVCTPRFVTRSGLAAIDEMQDLLDAESTSGLVGHAGLYGRLRVPPRQLEAASSAIRHWVGSGLLIDGEAVPEVQGVGVDQAARDAAAAVLGAAGPREQLVAHVAAMELPDGVDRADVEARALRYLRWI
jgi:hypothetical protein